MAVRNMADRDGLTELHFELRSLELCSVKGNLPHRIYNFVVETEF